MSFGNPTGYIAFGPTQLEQQQHQQIQKLEGQIAGLHKEPLAILTVMALTGNGRGVLAGAPPIEVTIPDGAKVGSQIRCIPQKPNGFTLLPEPISFGQVADVVAVQGPLATVKGAFETLAAIADGLDIKAGDRVALDPSGSVVLKKVQGNSSFAAATQKVSWDDIGGQEEAKEALREAIEYPVRFAEVYAAHGQKPAKGALLWGPPGTGKSMLAKALATSLSGDTGGFIYVKGSEVMSKWQGESGRTVRSLFARGRKHQAETGNRAVLFVDEADSLLPVRDGSGVKIGGGAEDMVPVFLNEMDGLDELGPFVLLATNRPDRIDPAVLRDGRCDAKVHVARPRREDCVAIFKLALRGRSVEPGTRDLLAEQATEALFSERLILLELTYPGVRTSEYLRLRDLVSGAVIEGIVQRAASLAIKRDRESGEVSRLSFGDIEAAIMKTLRQQAGENHDAVIRDLSKAFGKLPEKVRKVIDG